MWALAEPPYDGQVLPLNSARYMNSAKVVEWSASASSALTVRFGAFLKVLECALHVRAAWHGI